MARDLILGTAGHIDHGKTSLIKALTGIDCDRLPEEKARGITIDIGFAHLALGDIHFGIVDVPGHERFVKNMLAGATGIDLALLVVAADDSVMPQTREHLEILQFLGVKQGVIALTKADRVDATTREVVQLEIRELVQDTFLADAPIIATSTHTGEGLDELKAALVNAAGCVEPHDSAEWFRLPIDRAFVLQGHGTVVTGSVVSGAVRSGEELEWHKGDGTSERIRIRGLSQHGQLVDASQRGQRAAVNMAGVSHEQVRRGQELATPGYLRASRVLTVRLAASHESRRPIKHRLPCRLHIGTAEILGTISLLDCDTIAPGHWGFAQFFLEEHITAIWGQPFVVRDSSAEHTIGGGHVLQPVATKIRRRHVDVVERMEKLWMANPETRVLLAVWFAGFQGCEARDLVSSTALPIDKVEAIAAVHVASTRLIAPDQPGHRQLLVHADRWTEVEAMLLASLTSLHEQFPLHTTHDRQKTMAALDHVGNAELLRCVTDRLLMEKKLIGDERRIARADFKPKLSANQRKLKDKIVAAHAAARFQPPEPREFVNHAAGNATALRDIYEVAVAEGLLVKVSAELFLHADADQHMRQKVNERLAEAVGATVAEIRDLLGTTRKYAVPICEYLDQVGVTRREGDLRVRATT